MTSSQPLRPRSTRLAVLAPLALVTLIWGSTWIVIRDQLGVVPPSWSVTYRFAVAGAAMALLALAKRQSFRLGRGGYALGSAVGLAQFCVNFNFVYRAEGYITSGLVAVVFALLLVPNAVMARLFLGQRMGRQLLLGSAIAVGGIALLFVHESRQAAAGPGALLAGVGFTLAGVFFASIANVLQATERARGHPMLPLIAVAMLAGAAGDALIAWITAGPPVIDPRPGYLAGVAYLALLGSVLTFPLYFGVIREIGPAKAAYSSVVIPVIAMLLSTVFEGYRWSLLAVAGSVLAMAGLVVALTARRPNR